MQPNNGTKNSMPRRDMTSLLSLRERSSVGLSAAPVSFPRAASKGPTLRQESTSKLFDTLGTSYRCLQLQKAKLQNIDQMSLLEWNGREILSTTRAIARQVQTVCANRKDPSYGGPLIEVFVFNNSANSGLYQLFQCHHILPYSRSATAATLRSSCGHTLGAVKSISAKQKSYRLPGLY